MEINLKNSKNILSKGDILLFHHKKVNLEGLDKNLHPFLKKLSMKGKSLGNIKSFNLIGSKVSSLHILNAPNSSISEEEARVIGGEVAKLMKSSEIDEISIDFENLPKIEIKKVIAHFVEGAILANYQFKKHFKDHKGKEDKKLKINMVIPEGEDLNSLEKNLEEHIHLANCVNRARDLANEPGNIMTPSELAKYAEIFGKENGFDVEVFGRKEIEKLKMESYLAVAKGSSEEPKLIVMRYFGDKKSKEILGLVGKGVTFDTGGLSLKPPKSMLGMKFDMSGGASVMGAISAIAKMKLKVNVTAVVAACENSVSGNAYRPDDIIGSMSGKSVEVLNTDAEGRLTLIDAIHYIKEKEGATKVVNIATLTGAVVICLGHLITGALSNNDPFFKELESATKASGEEVWRLPRRQEFRQLLKSSVADIANVNYSGGANSITAGMFIEEFVGKTPWIHLDIAGTSEAKYGKSYIGKGASGVGVRTLYHLAKVLEKKGLKNR